MNKTPTEAVDVLKTLYQENMEYCRHHENLRATVTNVITLIAVALIGLITYDQKLTRSDFVPALVVLLLGFYGGAFTLKHYERYRLHSARLDKILEMLEQGIPESRLSGISQYANMRQQKEFPRMSTVRLHHFWISLNLVFSLLGLGLAVASLI